MSTEQDIKYGWNNVHRLVNTSDRGNSVDHSLPRSSELDFYIIIGPVVITGRGETTTAAVGKQREPTMVISAGESDCPTQDGFLDLLALVSTLLRR
ncbi:unnamed protein product [Linum trigynum]|uniref:Uncharacterized protein n=1 Tax=Linum trigynum TaxID=586398 RepID=A0AAV2E8W4_9ROSI